MEQAQRPTLGCITDHGGLARSRTAKRGFILGPGGLRLASRLLPLVGSKIASRPAGLPILMLKISPAKIWAAVLLTHTLKHTTRHPGGLPLAGLAVKESAEDPVSRACHGGPAAGDGPKYESSAAGKRHWKWYSRGYFSCMCCTREPLDLHPVGTFGPGGPFRMCSSCCPG